LLQKKPETRVGAFTETVAAEYWLYSQYNELLLLASEADHGFARFFGVDRDRLGAAAASAAILRAPGVPAAAQ
jgi:hypothetical protein